MEFKERFRSRGLYALPHLMVFPSLHLLLIYFLK